jgi:eukaryotic-like serine/threonine-protein kinase
MSTEPAAAVALARGAVVGGCEIRAHVHSGNSSLVYQARRGDGLVVALKVARAPGSHRFEHEADLLGRLEGCPAPSVVARGRVDDRHYLVTTWAPGIDVRIIGAERRAGPAPRRELAGLCAGILAGYADVHEREVVHGQVHPRHIVADGGGSVQILDFTRGTWRAGPVPPGCGPWALGTLSSPEEAAAWRSGTHCAVTAAAEQYSLAALLYLVVTGRLYADFASSRPTVAEQILTARPLRFTVRGIQAWPALEQLLARGLSKDPAARFGSVREFANEVAALAEGSRERIARSIRPRLVEPPLARLLADFRQATRIGGAFVREGLPNRSPCSVNNGAPGVALALCRLARTGDDATALREAAAWLDLAGRESRLPRAFYDGDVRTPETIGAVSPYHTASGLDLVRAFIARACGDAAAQQEAIDAFLARVDAPCASLDLTVGRSSVLVGCALLHDHAARQWPATHRLGAYGDALCEQIWAELETNEPGYLGIAHGRAGIAYATLLWSRTRGFTPPEPVRRVLDRLAAAAEPWRRGARWPRRTDARGDDVRYWPGWCHGQAGQVFLWTLASVVYEDQAFLELAELAAWSTWDSARSSSSTSLCCGAAGAVYALLSLHRRTAEPAWLLRAASLANTAALDGRLASDAVSPYSLYKGHLGLAMIAGDLCHPEHSAMPAFEPEP